MARRVHWASRLERVGDHLLLSSYQPTDRELLGGLMRREYGAAVMDRIDTYRLYYSLYFAGAWNDDPNLYRWCVNNLNQAIADQRT